MLKYFCMFLLGITLALTITVFRAGLVETGLLFIGADLICGFMAGICYYEGI